MQVTGGLPLAFFQRNTPVPCLVAPDKWRMIKLATTETKKEKLESLMYTEMIKFYNNVTI